MTLPAIPSRVLGGSCRPCSVLALGTSSLGTIDRAQPIYDRFMECGGNFFDTAFVYGQNFEPGCCESTLGTWIASRGARDEVVILGKGGHPPSNTPEAVERELHTTLERLQTDYLDVYMLHRDSPAVPVGEFVDLLCSFQAAGLVHAYGFSNWTLDRMQQARRYARARSLPPPVALSNNLSLAVMEKPIYPGCISVSDRESRYRLAADSAALIPWSSQGRGVFTAVRDARDFRASELADCWFSEGNLHRLQRARELARRRGVLPVNVALAWVLGQPFPTFPIIGPRSVPELESSLPALGVDLDEAEMAWLNLEDQPPSAALSGCR